MSSALGTWIVVLGLSTGQVIYEPYPNDGQVIYEEAGSGIGGSGDPLYPYDGPEPWLHGYFQDIPAYGGYAHFRPHNYKHVFAQSQVSAGWGFSPQHAYSQQFWHRYEAMSSMRLHLPNYPTPADPRRPGQQPAVSDIYRQSYVQPRDDYYDDRGQYAVEPGYDQSYDPRYEQEYDPRYAAPVRNAIPMRPAYGSRPPVLSGPNGRVN
ncbi:MAG: hypothetical protein O2955_01945 [Planctomycetota bacterium]|nr:hypothetical protein [Planctomycetota bacterium]MDA1211245.1 hypothetical protein [Planctomycetota bacterium]